MNPIIQEVKGLRSRSSIPLLLHSLNRPPRHIHLRKPSQFSSTRPSPALLHVNCVVSPHLQGGTGRIEGSPRTVRVATGTRILACAGGKIADLQFSTANGAAKNKSLKRDAAACAVVIAGWDAAAGAVAIAG